MISSKVCYVFYRFYAKCKGFEKKIFSFFEELNADQI